jgi:predicted transcriptional regulator
MTAKEALRDRIQQLTEEQAAEWLARIEWELTEFEEVSEKELAEILASQAEYERGESVDGKELLRELGL